LWRNCSPAIGDASHDREAERIHLLILKISRLDVNRMRHLVAAAKRDYRDVIVWASHPFRIYIVGLLRNGPNAAPENKATLKLSSVEEWKRAGAIVIGGQCEEKGELRALYICPPLVVDRMRGFPRSVACANDSRAGIRHRMRALTAPGRIA
jgi:hypothetical protein